MKLTATDLKDIRKFIGITQQELADHLEISQASVAHYERNAIEIPPYVATKLEMTGERLAMIKYAKMERKAFLTG